MPWVYSTASAGADYTSYRKITKDLNQAVKKVSIAGGSNVVGKNLITPLGVATQVSDEDLEFLMANSLFKKHMNKGFIRVEKTKKDPEKVITSTGMELRDGAAPETPETIAAKGAKFFQGKPRTIN